MVTRIRVPTLDANIEEVAVTEWLKKEGDKVRKGEAIAEFTTDKAAFEFESPCSGVLRRLLAKERSTVPVGFIIALVADANEPLPDVTPENEKLLAIRRQSLQVARKRDPAVAGQSRARVRATPAARRLARELDVDLASLRDKTGEDVITEDAVRSYWERRKNDPGR